MKELKCGWERAVISNQGYVYLTDSVSFPLLALNVDQREGFLVVCTGKNQNTCMILEESPICPFVL